LGGKKPTNAQVINDHRLMATAVRDLAFIMSELSCYLQKNEFKNSFLEMIVGLISQKQILINSQHGMH
jgi:hypothetical protein